MLWALMKKKKKRRRRKFSVCFASPFLLTNRNCGSVKSNLMLDV
jgi:hypothetical protein